MTYETMFFQTKDFIQKQVALNKAMMKRLPSGSEYAKELKSKNKALQETLDQMEQLEDDRPDY